jgi:hypothetical protein
MQTQFIQEGKLVLKGMTLTAGKLMTGPACKEKNINLHFIPQQFTKPDKV